MFPFLAYSQGMMPLAKWVVFPKQLGVKFGERVPLV